MIPNVDNEAVWYKFRIQWIPNGANEAVFDRYTLQWIPNGANEAAIWCKLHLHGELDGSNKTVSSFSHLIDIYMPL